MIETKLTNNDFEIKIIDDATGECEVAISVDSNLFEGLENYFESLDSQLFQLEQENNEFREVPESIKNKVHSMLSTSKKIAADFVSSTEIPISVAKKIFLQELDFINRLKAVIKKIDLVTSSQDEKIFTECQKELISIKDESTKLLEFCNLYRMNQDIIVDLFDKELSLLEKNISQFEGQLTQLFELINKLDRVKFKMPHALFTEISNSIQAKIDSCKRFCEHIVSWREADKELRSLFVQNNNLSIEKLDNAFIKTYEEVAESKEIHITSYGKSKINISLAKIASDMIEHFKGKINSGEIELENIEDEKMQVIIDFMERNVPENQGRPQQSSNDRPCGIPFLIPVNEPGRPIVSTSANQNNSVPKVPSPASTNQFQAILSSSRHALNGSNSPAIQKQNQIQQGSNIVPPKTKSFFFCCGK